MWWKLNPRFLFSQEGFKSSFQIRAKLSEFFKHTHPDTNQNAPQTIKEENLRSLKNLNAYIDSLLQSKPIEAKLLKFYVSEKSNQKSKKYYAFEVELPIVQHNINDQHSKKILNNVIEILNTKFLETRMLKNPLLKKELNRKEMSTNAPPETEEQRKARMQSQLKPYRQRKRSFPEQFKQLMNQKIKDSQANMGKESLLGELQKKVLLANTPSNKPLLWSRIAMKKSGLYNNYQSVLSNIIDPSLVYMNQSLTKDQIDQFKTRLLPGEESLKPKQQQQHNKMHKIFLQMQDALPPILLYVTTHYSARDIPGFFSIPFNFKPEDFVQNFRKHIREIVNERTKYQQLYDALKDAISALKAQNNISIEFQDFKNNADISRKLLMVKRLSYYKAGEPILLVPFDDLDFQHFCQEYGLDQKIGCHSLGTKIVARIQFSDDQMRGVLGKI